MAIYNSMMSSAVVMYSVGGMGLAAPVNPNNAQTGYALFDIPGYPRCERPTNVDPDDDDEE